MEQIDLLRYAVETLEELNLRYAVVGAFASGAYGEPRFTQDIDVVFELPASQIARFCRTASVVLMYLGLHAICWFGMRH